MTCLTVGQPEYSAVAAALFSLLAVSLASWRLFADLYPTYHPVKSTEAVSLPPGSLPSVSRCVCVTSDRFLVGTSPEEPWTRVPRVVPTQVGQSETVRTAACPRQLHLPYSPSGVGSVPSLRGLRILAVGTPAACLSACVPGWVVALAARERVVGSEQLAWV